MKIGFLGISEFGLNFFKHIIEKYDVVFATGKSKEAKHTRSISELFSKLCLENNVNYLGNVNVNEKKFINLSKTVDLIVLGGYDKILKKEIIDAPRIGIINTHLGLIPQNRGCNPVMWSLLRGESQGYTTYFVNEKIDDGKILDMQVVDCEDMNAFFTYKKISKICSKNIMKTLSMIEEGYLGIEPRGLHVYHKQGMPNDGCVSWAWTNKFLMRFSKSLDFSPYLPMHTILDDKKYFLRIKKIGKKTFKENISDGTILERNNNIISVKTKDGYAVCELD